MRVMICYPWLDLGGAPNTAISIAKGIRELGHEVLFFTKPGGIYEERLQAADIEMIPASYSKALPHMYHLNAGAYRKMIRAIEDHSIDLIHCFHFNDYYLALFAAAARNIPVVYSAVWFLDDAPHPAYRGRVTFVAEEFLDKARGSFGGFPREMTVIPNRIDLETFHPDVASEDVAQKYDLPGDGYKIVFMSRVDPTKSKSLHHAVEAVKEIAAAGTRVYLVIAGDGVSFGDLAAKMENVNSELGYKAVILTGAVVETPGLLAWADIVLGIGRCAWEGMATGKPTLVVGENGLAGVVEPEKVDELKYYNFAGRNLEVPVGPGLLSEALNRIINDRELYERLASFSRQYVLDNYDYRKGAEKFEKLYQRALDDPRMTRMERFRLLLSVLRRGYFRQLYLVLRVVMRGYLGRGRPEDKMVH
ncbi:MAG: glycosyltransferase family 4 protein [Bacteroidales bacterium]|nr:glycosyltransferase family 4 protein [Candidatus Latescibacterota bacterium]